MRPLPMGRPLKPPEIRRNRVPPGRGEWVTLPELTEPVLEPANPRWCAEAKRLWEAVRRDPVSTQYGPSDIQMLKETMGAWPGLSREGQWRRMTELGCTPKGKRDLRWRSPEEAKTIAEQAPIKRLRLAERLEEGTG